MAFQLILQFHSPVDDLFERPTYLENLDDEYNIISNKKVFLYASQGNELVRWYGIEHMHKEFIRHTRYTTGSARFPTMMSFRSEPAGKILALLTRSSQIPPPLSLVVEGTSPLDVKVEGCATPAESSGVVHGGVTGCLTRLARVSHVLGAFSDAEAARAPCFIRRRLITRSYDVGSE